MKIQSLSFHQRHESTTSSFRSSRKDQNCFCLYDSSRILRVLLLRTCIRVLELNQALGLLLLTHTEGKMKGNEAASAIAPLAGIRTPSQPNAQKMEASRATLTEPLLGLASLMLKYNLYKKDRTQVQSELRCRLRASPHVALHWQSRPSRIERKSLVWAFRPERR